MVSSDLPTTFLPQLPRQALNTLSPLTEPELTGHIDHLRSLLIQDIYGTSSSPAVSTSSHIGSSSFSSRGSSSGAHKAILEGFERDWAEKWLHGLITRGEGWLAEVEPEDYHDEDDIDDLAFDMEEGHEGSTTRRRASMSSELKSQWAEYSTREKVIKDASALISSLAGCAAGGGITRDLSFPLDSSEELVLRVYDAALSDHTSVGVQTWGSAILLGRIFALDPLKYLGISEAIAYRSSTKQENDGDWSEIPRILELGAGTGVMAILCRMLLDRLAQDNKIPGLAGQTIGEVLATDYHPLVLSNLQRCIDLNFKGDRNPESNGIDKTGQDGAPVEPVASTDVDGLRKMLLDWSTFPGIVQQWQEKDREGLRAERTERIPEQKGDWTLPPQVLLSQPSTSSTHADSSTSLAVQMSSVLNKPWDIIIAADCVYDLSHASMIRDVVKWCLRAPELDGDGNLVREGGVLHLLSPIRPTYAAETTSINQAFPQSHTLPGRNSRSHMRERRNISRAQEGIEGLSIVSAKLSQLRSSSGQSGSSTTGSGPSRHIPSTANSGLNTPRVDRKSPDRADFLTPDGLAPEDFDMDEFLSINMGRGDEGNWVLATKERRALERMKGNGRSDEVEYWWWEIGWC